ncbi:unnamed protein product, partial [Prunus brigantina]
TSSSSSRRAIGIPSLTFVVVVLFLKGVLFPPDEIISVRVSIYWEVSLILLSFLSSYFKSPHLDLFFGIKASERVVWFKFSVTAARVVAFFQLVLLWCCGWS